MRAVYSEVVTLVRILLVIHATNATSERFSAPRREETYLRSAMTQTRLKSLMTYACTEYFVADFVRLSSFAFLWRALKVECSE